MIIELIAQGYLTTEEMATYVISQLKICDKQNLPYVLPENVLKKLNETYQTVNNGVKMSKYIGCWFGLEESAEENGEMRIAHAFEAVNDKQAKAKAALLFMEAFPDGDDSQFEFRMYAEADGIPCPTEEWDETFLFEHEWDDDLGHPVANVQASPVDFDKLQPSVRVAVLVKYNTTEITSDQLGAAIELQQGDSSTFDSHITDAISKMPAIVSMYPERILEAIQYIRDNCAP